MSWAGLSWLVRCIKISPWNGLNVYAIYEFKGTERHSDLVDRDLTMCNIMFYDGTVRTLRGKA